MAILTKFLKLLKPERNDYVDVEKHLSENYDKIDTKIEELSNSNDKKLDKGAVSSEYDTAKKIEDKIKTVQSTANNKVSKSGDTMTGKLEINNSLEAIQLKLNRNNGSNAVIEISSSEGTKYFGFDGTDIKVGDAANLKSEGKKIWHEDNFNPNLKLNSGGYVGTAKDLESLINKKVSKTGDTITGKLNISSAISNPLTIERTDQDYNNININFKTTNIDAYFGFNNNSPMISNVANLGSGFNILINNNVELWSGFVRDGSHTLTLKDEIMNYEYIVIYYGQTGGSSGSGLYNRGFKFYPTKYINTTNNIGSNKDREYLITVNQESRALINEIYFKTDNKTISLKCEGENGTAAVTMILGINKKTIN